MFSITDSSNAFAESTLRTWAGTALRPAAFAARQRRSPAMISKELPDLRTTMG